MLRIKPAGNKHNKAIDTGPGSANVQPQVAQGRRPDRARPAHAASYSSVIAFGSGAESVRLDFSTSLTSGPVTAGDLTDLTFTLLDGATVLFQDAAIVGGTVQDLKGQARDITSIGFWFDIDTYTGATGGFGGFLNEFTGSGSTGTVYVLRVPDVSYPVVNAFFYQDGAFDLSRSIFGNITSVTTTVVPLPDAVPLPAALPLLLAGLGGLALVRRRR